MSGNTIDLDVINPPPAVPHLQDLRQAIFARVGMGRRGKSYEGIRSFKMGKLILVRHGRTVLNSHGESERLRGWLDVPLDENGLQEARATAGRIAQHPIEKIFCSDLMRAQQTAEAIADVTKLPIIHAPELRPWNVGSLAGQQVSTILPALKKLEEDPDLPAPQGESFHQFYHRYSAKLKHLLALATRSSKCIVAVTHVRNVLATRTILVDGDKRKIPVRGGAKTGAIVWVEHSGGKWVTRAESDH
jgi:broad specificity phosphatase PhoE